MPGVVIGKFILEDICLKASWISAARTDYTERRREKACTKQVELVLLPSLPQKATATATGTDSVAQLVEQYTFNVWVLGSNPSGITKNLVCNLQTRFFRYRGYRSAAKLSG
jgi:hypothetical protein